MDVSVIFRLAALEANNRIVPTTELKSSYAIGDVVRFSFEGNIAHVFSKETGKNLEY